MSAIRAFFRNCGDRFHRFMDYAAPLDPSWASEPSTLDNLDRPTMTFADYADHARRLTEDIERPSGEHGDVRAMRAGLTADERRGDGRVA